MVDFFDPTTWVKDEHEYRIYADDYANEYAIVDAIDYHWAIQWRWGWKESRIHKGTKVVKRYLFRPAQVKLGEDVFIDGKRYQQRRQENLFLHVAIMERTGIPKPITNQKIIVDHANSKDWDCRRSNLRYATVSFNNRNRHGALEKELV